MTKTLRQLQEECENLRMQDDLYEEKVKNTLNEIFKTTVKHYQEIAKAYPNYISAKVKKHIKDGYAVIMDDVPTFSLRDYENLSKDNDFLQSIKSKARNQFQDIYLLNNTIVYWVYEYLFEQGYEPFIIVNSDDYKTTYDLRIEWT